MKMPEGLFFLDKDGTKRSEIRIKWWEYPSVMAAYKSIGGESIGNPSDQAVSISEFNSLDFYSNKDKKVFFIFDIFGLKANHHFLRKIFVAKITA